MKIISWNCNCAFRNKYQLLPPADVLIVQESESPEFLQKHGICLPFLRHLWVGKKAHKGLSIFCSVGTDVKIADFYNEAFEFIVPVEVQRKGRRFILWAVWTQAEGNDCYNGYVVTLTKAMIYYEKYLREDSLIAGDFNSNACWNNHFKREFNHDSLVAFLEKNKFFSLYHHFAGCVHGAEKEATIFMYRDEKRPYYIDYVFAHEKVLDKRPVFKIGTYGDWSKYSDHMPLFVEISD